MKTCNAIVGKAGLKLIAILSDLMDSDRVMSQLLAHRWLSFGDRYKTPSNTNNFLTFVV
jgi:hypothetical protein